MKLRRLLRFGSKIFTHHLTGVGLILTRRCNLDCKYCQVIQRPSEAELTPQQWMQIIDRMSAHRHRHFVITGGEPLMYDGVEVIIGHAARHNLVSLISNGTLLDEGRLDGLRELDFLTVSVDGSEPDEVSRKCSVDLFELLGEYSRRHGVEIQTITTITAVNVDHVPDVIRRSSEAGFVSLLSVIHSGQGPYSFRGDHPELMFRTPEQLDQLRRTTDELIRMRRRGVLVGESEAFLRDMVPFAAGEYQIDCPAADGVFEIDADGSIMACHDAPPSAVSALEFGDYDEMVREVRTTIPSPCTCFYDCFYDLARRRREPLRAVGSLVRDRLHDLSPVHRRG